MNATTMHGPTNEGLDICPCACTCGPECDHETCPCPDCVGARDTLPAPPPEATEPPTAPEPAAPRAPNAYQEKRAARVERMRERAERMARAGAARVETAQKMASVIPFGQPIHMGHHSEKRDRNYRERIGANFRKGFEMTKEAEALARRADAAEDSTAVSSDDPDAVVKLRAKVAACERAIEGTKAANKLLAASPHPPPPDVIVKVAELLGWEPRRTASTLGIVHSMGRRGGRTFSTTNESAERRRLLARVEHLERTAAAPEKAPEVIGEVRLEESDNRLRIYFPGKPSAEVRAKLKRAGFRWSPTAGAWQRMPNAWAWTVARDVAAACKDVVGGAC